MKFKFTQKCNVTKLGWLRKEYKVRLKSSLETAS